MGMSKAVVFSLLVIQLVCALPLDRVGNWQSSFPGVVHGRHYTSAPLSAKRDSPDPLYYDVVRSPKLVVLGEEESVEHVLFDPATMTLCVDISLNTDAYSWVSSKNIGLDTILNGVSTQAFLIHVDRQIITQSNSVRACGYPADLSEAFETATISFNQDTPSVSSKAERFGGDFALYGVKPNDVYAVGHEILVSFEGAGASAAGEIAIYSNGVLKSDKHPVTGASGKANLVVPAAFASNTAVYEVVYRCTNNMCAKLEAASPSFTVPVGRVTFSSPDEEYELDPSKVSSIVLRWSVSGYPVDTNMKGFMTLYRTGDEDAMTDQQIKAIPINSADAAQKSKVFAIDDVKDDLIASPWRYYFKYTFNCVGQKCYYANGPSFTVPLSYSYPANPGHQVVEDRDCESKSSSPDPFEMALAAACEVNPNTEYRAELTTLKASAGVTINYFNFTSNFYDHYEFFTRVTVHAAAEMRMEAKLDFAFDYQGLDKGVFTTPVPIADAYLSIAGVVFNYKATLDLFYKVHITNTDVVEFTVPVVMPIPDVWMEAGFGTDRPTHTDFGLASEFPLVIKPVDVEGIGPLTLDMDIKPRIIISLFDADAVKRKQLEFYMTTEAYATLVSEYNADLYDALPDGYEKSYEAHYPATCNFKHRRHYKVDSGLRMFDGAVHIDMKTNKFIVPFERKLDILDHWKAGVGEMMVAGCLQRAQCKMFYPNSEAHLAEFCPSSDLGAKCKLSCAENYQGDQGEWACVDEKWVVVSESTCELDESNKGLTTGDYVAITAGSIGGVSILAFIVVCAGKKRKRVSKKETLMPSSITGVVVESTVIDVENPKSYGTTIVASSSSVASMNTTTGEADFATLPTLSTTSAATPAVTSPPTAAATPAAPITSPPVTPEVRPISPASGAAVIN